MAYFRCGGGGIPSSLKTDMNAVLNKKFGTQSENYPPTEWADDVNLMGLLPIRTASGTIAHFEDGADDVPMKSITANITPIQSGTGTPSPSNPRPISGTDELTLNHKGKNLFDAEKIVEDSNNQYVYIQDGYLLFNTRDNKNFTFDNLNFPCPVSFSGTVKSFSAYENLIRVRGVFSDGTTQDLDVGMLQPNSEISFSGTFGTSGKTLTRMCNIYTSDKQAGFDLSTTQLELGSTATTYEPYTSSTYTVNLGQTIYGGTADVVGGVGESTHGFLTLNGSEDWVNVGGSYPQAFQLDTGITNAFQGNIATQKANNISNLYPWSTTEVENYAIRWQVGYQSGRLFVYDNNYSSNLAGFKQHLSDNNLQIAYLLVTPTPLTFTGQPINSYLGTNNLYTDSGEVLDVEYRADMNLLIAELEGNRGLQMMMATPTEENDEQEATENEGER